MSLNSIQAIYSLQTIFTFLAALTALWIAGRIVLRTKLTNIHTLHFILWLMLGALFLIPLTDAIRYLSTLLSMLSPDAWEPAMIPVVLGAGPLQV